MNTNQDAANRQCALPSMGAEDYPGWTGGLAERDARLRVIVETEPECVKLLAGDGSLLEMNPAGLRMIEADSFQQVANHCVYSLVAEEYRADFKRLTERVFQGESGTLEFRIVGLKGGCRWLETHAVPWRDAGGKVTAVLGLTRDITKRKNAEEALRNSEERLRLALSAANQGLYDLNVQTGEVQVSSEYATMLGYDPLEFRETKASWVARIHPDDRGKVEASFNACVEGRIPVYQVEFRQRMLTNEWKWILSLGKIVARDEHGRPLRMLGTHTDITERKIAEELLRSQEEHLTSLIYSVDGVVWESDAQTFRLTYVSPRAERMLGYPLALWTTEPFFWANHVHPDDRERVMAYNRECTREKRGHEFEYRMIAADAREVWVRDIITVVVENGEPSKLRGIMVDITTQKQTELRIRKLNRTYSVLNAINQLIVRAQGPQEVLDGACRVAVEKGGFLLGCIGMLDEPTGRLKRAAHAGVHRPSEAASREMFAILFEACAFTSVTVATGSRAVCNDIAKDAQAGAIRALSLEQGYRAMASFPLVVEGRLIGTFNLYADQPGFFNDAELELLDELAVDISFAMGALRQVQERHRAEAALQESEERYKLVERAVNDGLWDWNILTGEDYLSPRWKEILGYTDDELPNKQASCLELIHPDDKAAVSAVAREHLKGGKRFSSEFRMRHKDGTDRWVLSRGEVVRDISGKPVRMVGAMTDITERRKTNDELLRREEHFRRLIENASDLITAVNNQGVITYQSPAAMRSLGHAPEDMVGRKWSEFIHPDDCDAVQFAMISLLERREPAVSVECRVRHKDGAWRIFQSIGRSVPDDSEEGFIIVNSRDLTEMRHLEQQLRQSQKMEAIGQLAGGVAHDFNNILAAIIMQAEVAAMAQDVPEEVKDGLQHVCAYAERAAKLIRQLLLFSRRQVMQTRALDINDVITHLAQMLQRIIGEDVRLELELHPEPLMTRADSGMLDQVLLNLAVNARDAMPAGGRLCISTTAAIVNADFARLHPDASPGHYVCISVTDTGVGIPNEILPRIFEPFFTTKELGKGTGLGLATIFGIVKQHSGWVEVKSELGLGATFRIFLPAIEILQNPFAAPARMAPPGGGTETILLVEDEPAVRELTCLILKRYGYQVVEAFNAIHALEIWGAHRDTVALVLTDLVMPGGVTGHQLAERLLADKPQLKVVFMSGYSASIAGRELEVGTDDNFVQKPFLPNQLLGIIRSCLDR